MTPVDFSRAWIEVLTTRHATDVAQPTAHLWFGTIGIVSPAQRSGVVLHWKSLVPVRVIGQQAENGQGFEGCDYPAFSPDGPYIACAYYLRRPIAHYGFIIEGGRDQVFFAYRFEGEELSEWIPWGE